MYKGIDSQDMHINKYVYSITRAALLPLGGIGVGLSFLGDANENRQGQMVLIFAVVWHQIFRTIANCYCTVAGQFQTQTMP